jgi:hypothetical protein
MARRIHDLRLGMTGRLTGMACLTPCAQGLNYEEAGELQFGAYRGDVTARYRFVIDDGNTGAIAVLFADGRLFHRLDLSSGRDDVLHDCAPDRYRGRYRATGPDGWASSWHIAGPRKRMLIATRYARATP